MDAVEALLHDQLLGNMNSGGDFDIRSPRFNMRKFEKLERDFEKAVQAEIAGSTEKVLRDYQLEQKYSISYE